MTFVLSGCFFVIGRAGCLSYWIVLLHLEWPIGPFGPRIWYCELLGTLCWLRSSSHNSKFRHHQMRKQTIGQVGRPVTPSIHPIAWDELDPLSSAKFHSRSKFIKLIFHSLYVVIVSTLTMDEGSRVEEGRLSPNIGHVEVISPGNCKLSAMRQF